MTSRLNTENYKIHSLTTQWIQEISWLCPVVFFFQSESEPGKISRGPWSDCGHSIVWRGMRFFCMLHVQSAETAVELFGSVCYLQSVPYFFSQTDSSSAASSFFVGFVVFLLMVLPRFFFPSSTCSCNPIKYKQLNSTKKSILLTCPANNPHTPTMQRMLKTAEPTMVPTPTSPWVINTPAEEKMLLPPPLHFRPQISQNTYYLGITNHLRVLLKYIS